MNRAIREKLELFNQKLFQKKEGSRLSLFLEDEKPLLAPLPASRFELSDWKTATVQFNYHISVDGIFELLHRRRKKSSTIFCSQYGFEEWYDQLGGDDSPLADAIIDRIAHDSYRINITSIDAEHDISMREVYGLDKMLRE